MPKKLHAIVYTFNTAFCRIPSSDYSYLNLGTTGLFVTASATQPPIKHNPPSGVTGPRNLNLCGSRTSRYIDPENIVMPAVNRPIPIVFCGATTEVNVRTAE